MNTLVKSAERVLDILELFSAREQDLALRDVAGTLGIPKSSALMLLRTLEGRGYLARAERNRYRLDPRLADGETGWVAGSPAVLLRAARPVMQRLVDDIGETTTLGVLSRELDVEIVAYINSPQIIRFDISDTPRLPCYCSALGKMLLSSAPPAFLDAYLAAVPLERINETTITDPAALRAHLREVAAAGFSETVDERVVGASGAAFPIRGADGSVVAAINIATVTFRYCEIRDKVLAALQHAAADISTLIGGTRDRGAAAS